MAAINRDDVAHLARLAGPQRPAVQLGDALGDLCAVRTLPGLEGAGQQWQLGALFETTAAGLLPEGRARRIVEATWGLDAAPDVRGFTQLASLQ